MVTYVDSHTPLVITVILIMFQYVNILKQYVFQDFIPGFRITMRTYVDRVRDVRPKGGIKYTDITAIPIIIPTVGELCNHPNCAERHHRSSHPSKT